MLELTEFATDSERAEFKRGRLEAAQKLSTFPAGPNGQAVDISGYTSAELIACYLTSSRVLSAYETGVLFQAIHASQSKAIKALAQRWVEEIQQRNASKTTLIMQNLYLAAAERRMWRVWLCLTLAGGRRQDTCRNLRRQLSILRRARRDFWDWA